MDENEEKYIHPAELEYMAFRPVFLREEKRRMWTGSRYEMRMCVVYDAGKCDIPKAFKWEDLPVHGHPRKQRTRWDTEQLINSMCEYLDEHGASTAKDIAAGIEVSRDTIAAIVRKQSIFVVVGRGERVKGKAGIAPYLYDMREDVRI
jgi:hypothetical protein